jgi:hypothetical protein
LRVGRPRRARSHSIGLVQCPCLVFRRVAECDLSRPAQTVLCMNPVRALKPSGPLTVMLGRVSSPRDLTARSGSSFAAEVIVVVAGSYWRGAKRAVTRKKASLAPAL